MNKKNKLSLFEMIILFGGMVTLAFAISAILKPNGLMMGGITGMSIILGKVTNSNYTFINYGISLAVLIATYVFLGKKEAQKILMVSVIFPLILIIVNILGWKLQIEDKLLAAIYYGVLAGAGTGMVFRCGFSTGGTDSIGKIIHIRLYPYISLSIIMTIMDVIVLTISIFVYDVTIALYALVSQVVFLKTINTVMFGFGHKLIKLEIVSDQYQAIEKFIINDIHRGVSQVQIVGAYTQERKTKIFTVCTPRESLLIKQYIISVDKAAFVMVMPVSSVWGIGEGFDLLEESD